jgi:enamine deaminase RidA (YjgF/YER057c/UK114 family)
MSRKLISQGSEFEAKIGYSRAVVQGDWIFVSGTTGYNYATMEISDDIAEQTRQCIRNIDWALTEAGASLRDIVRIKYILPNADDWSECWEPLRECFGDIRPAATMFVSGLSDASMKIEIEVTALRQP